MTTTLLAAVVLLLLVIVALQLLLVLRRPPEQQDRTTEIVGQIAGVEKVTNSATLQLKADLAGQRDELAQTLARHQQTLAQTLDIQRNAVEKLRASLDARVAQLLESLQQQAALTRAEHSQASQLLAKTLRDGTAALAETLSRQQLLVQQSLGEQRKALDAKLIELQTSNEAKLEQMRQTVDEKLHATLEARLGESFKQVSERLEAVQRGLGEMKTLADGVGDLKRVMGNVKTRGTWGEVQLRALIEDVLRPEEFVVNFAPRGRNERVEFAIRLPGASEDREVYLPVDSKFPVEDYQRLVDAQDAGDADAAKGHAKALEDRIKACAKDIHDKYLEPGVTTDFALLFLPFEGLYAEVLRRPGLVEHVQRVFHVAVCGPTTLAALLNSLRMGFRAVAIQKRSGDIGALLGAVKTEFANFGKVIDAVGGRLRQAQDEIDKVGVRTRAIHRKLQQVEALPVDAAAKLLPVGVTDAEEEES
jgi:DNA recombination protein RmuC